MMRVLIKDEQIKIKIDSRELKRLAQEILESLGSTDVELSLLLVDNLKIQELNKRYLGKDSPTDVLSFSMRDGEFGDINTNLIGDVVVSLERAGELAEEGNISFKTMVANLLIHGILHLSGYDHERGLEDARIMERKEKELFALITDKGLV